MNHHQDQKARRRVRLARKAAGRRHQDQGPRPPRARRPDAPDWRAEVARELAA